MKGARSFDLADPPLELTAITDKAWHEAFRRGCGRSGRERAMNIAHAALTGELPTV